MKTKPMLDRDRLECIADAAGLPLPFVRQVAAYLKAAGRIPATRPRAAAMTPETLARLLIGLSAVIAVKAPDVERAIGGAVRRVGAGEATFAAEVADIIAQAANRKASTIDWWAPGDIFIVSAGVTAGVINTVDVNGETQTRAYGESPDGTEAVTRYFRVPLDCVRTLALELIEEP